MRYKRVFVARRSFALFRDLAERRRLRFPSAKIQLTVFSGRSVGRRVSAPSNASGFVTPLKASRIDFGTIL
jgi:hypothetical protein